MPRWLMKTEPDDYSWERLEADGETEWTGVRNHQAAANLRAMRRRIGAHDYVLALVVVLACTVVCWLGGTVFSIADQAMIYLLGVLIVATRSPRLSRPLGSTIWWSWRQPATADRRATPSSARAMTRTSSPSAPPTTRQR